MYNYCTLFDSHYLSRGLAMYETLKEYSDKFHLYIFAFDDKSYALLQKLKLKNATIIALNEFENEALLSIKDSRNSGEYCWTCTPSIIKYSIEKYNLRNCTYLDADLYFFSNPSVLIDEMQEKSVLITEHRYTKEYDQTKTSGIYCVQFITFKNNEYGMKVLNWWVDSCIDWCYARIEDGKFGDQKYLDDWLIRFKDVHVLKNLGGGVAPWNVQQYDLLNKDFKLIFYHFHQYKFIGNSIDLGYYKLTQNDINLLYKPYSKHLAKITQKLKIIDDVNDYNGHCHAKTNGLKTLLKTIKRKAKGVNNVFDKKYLEG